jgi:uncharacterized Fe-S center protein
MYATSSKNMNFVRKLGKLFENVTSVKWPVSKEKILLKSHVVSEVVKHVVKPLF